LHECRLFKCVVRWRAAVKSLHVCGCYINRLYFSFGCECLSEDKQEHDYGDKGDYRTDGRD